METTVYERETCGEATRKFSRATNPQVNSSLRNKALAGEFPLAKRANCIIRRINNSYGGRIQYLVEEIKSKDPLTQLNFVI